jgi:fermentation-respiration switch protein FrsA (DUF1100 family)
LRAEPLLRTLGVAGLLLALLWVVVVGVLLVQEDAIVYQAGWSRVGIDTTLLPGWRRVRIPQADGPALDALVADPGNPARGTVIYFHGNAASIWSDQVREKVRAYQRLGYRVVAADYRGYGVNAGSPSEAGLLADARAVWEYTRDSLHADPGTVLIHGMSLGSGVAAALAVLHPPRLLILDGAFTSMPDVAAEEYPFVPARLLMRNTFPTLARLDSLRAPVLIVHARNDDVIPPHHGARLFAQAREPKGFLATDRGHVAGAFADAARFGVVLDSLLSPR